MHEFGFDTSMDFLNSTFGYAAKKPAVILSVSFGTVGTLVEQFIGLDPIVYMAFVVLIILEFFTGIRASLKEGKKIYSKKFGRVILKLLIYTTLIGVINIFRTRLDVPTMFDVEINLYSMIYYVTLNLIIVQLILSVFENLSRLGYEETSKVFKAISKILRKYIKLITPEEQREEEQREEKSEEKID
jgi:hypothetical protein